MKKTKLKIMSLVLAGILSVGFVSYKGYSDNIKVEATEGTEDTSWTVIDYNKLTDADLSAEDIALMHEDNWLNQEVASQCSKTVSDLTLSDFLSIKRLYYGANQNGITVDLECNTIDNIPKSIKFLSNLGTLYVYNQKNLKKISNEIGNLTNLVSLHLSSNGLTELPKAIGNLTKLDNAEIKWNNNLTELPDTIGNLTNLVSLSLEYSKLTGLPDTIGNLTNLKYLSLDNNKLTELPDTIGNLTNLKSLDLDGNNLTELPDTIGNLTKLEHFDLFNNKLTKLPNTIGNLTNPNLNILDLTNNNLTKLPNTIGNLTNLKRLDLDGNNLTELPDTIGNLTNLKYLYLQENDLIELPKTIGDLPNLQDLNLSYNLLEYIPAGSSNLKIKYNYTLVKGSNTVSQLYYIENISTGLTCSSLNELNTIINSIDYFKNNIGIYSDSYVVHLGKKLNKNILLKVVPIDNSFFDSNGNAIKTGDTYVYVKLNYISDSNPYGYIRKTYKKTNPTIVNSNDYLKIPVHIVQRNTSVSLRVDEELPIENILEEALKTSDISNITEEANNTTIQSLNESIISNEGKALSLGTTQVVLVTPNYGLITADINVKDDLKVEKTLNVKFTQPNTMSLTIDTNEIDFGEVNGLTDSSEKTVIASVNSSLPYDLSIKSLEENLTSTEGKTIPISKLNVKGEGEYTNIGTTDSIIYTNQPNTNGEGVAHPMNFKLSEMAGYTKGDYSTNLRVIATQR